VGRHSRWIARSQKKGPGKAPAVGGRFPGPGLDGSARVETRVYVMNESAASIPGRRDCSEGVRTGASLVSGVPPIPPRSRPPQPLGKGVLGWWRLAAASPRCRWVALARSLVWGRCRGSLRGARPSRSRGRLDDDPPRPPLRGVVRGRLPAVRLPRLLARIPSPVTGRPGPGADVALETDHRRRMGTSAGESWRGSPCAMARRRVPVCLRAEEQRRSGPPPSSHQAEPPLPRPSA